MSGRAKLVISLRQTCDGQGTKFMKNYLFGQNQGGKQLVLSLQSY